MRIDFCEECQLFTLCTEHLAQLRKSPSLFSTWSYRGQDWLMFKDGGFFPIIRPKTVVQQIKCIHFASRLPILRCGSCRFYAHICAFKWNVRAIDKPCTAKLRLGSSTYLDFNPLSPPKTPSPTQANPPWYKPAKGFDPHH